jgi:hypothetical protein
MRHPLSSGWPAAQVLNELITETVNGSAETFTASFRSELDAWADHCRQVLSGKTSTVSLTDEKSIVRRALLLLLLRGTVEGIASASLDDARSGIVVGRNVRMLALVLAAARTGLRALGRDYKSVATDAQSIDLRKSLSIIVVNEARGMLADSSRPISYEIDVRYVSLGPLRGEWEVRLPGTVTVRVPAGFHKRLQESYQRVRRIGLEEQSSTDWSFDAIKLLAAGPQGTKHKAVLRIPKGDQFSAISQILLPLEVRIPSRPERRGSRLGHGQFVAILTQILESQAQTGAVFRYVVSEDGVSLAILIELRLDMLSDIETKRAVVDACAEANRIAERIASLT